MSLFRMPWGGTLAIRRATFDAAGLLDQWSRSFNDDIVLGAAVSRLGLEVRFVPSLLMIEDGESPIQKVRSFIFRELMHLKFYLRAWPAIVVFGMLTILLVPASMDWLWAEVVRGDWVAALLSGAAIVAFVALLVISYVVVEPAGRAGLRLHRRPLGPPSLR